MGDEVGAVVGWSRLCTCLLSSVSSDLMGRIFTPRKLANAMNSCAIEKEIFVNNIDGIAVFSFDLTFSHPR